MKIKCHCGAMIIDQTDYLPHKAHLIPDQEWFRVLDAIDDEVVGSLAAGRIDKDTAIHLAREIIGRSSRSMYQCRVCGRVYIDNPKNQLHCYLPASEETAKEVLRSRGGPSGSGKL